MGSDIGYTSYTKAPDVDYITVAKAGTPEGEQLQAEDAILEGNAAVVNGGGCYGTGYVTGLSANGGSITFHKTVDEPGQYVLTIGFKKTASTTSKYAQIEVNGERTYETTIARTSGWSNTGRQQVYISTWTRVKTPSRSSTPSTARRRTPSAGIPRWATP